MESRIRKSTEEVRAEIRSLSGIAEETAQQLPELFFNRVASVSGDPNTPADRYNAARYENLAFLRLEGEPTGKTLEQATEQLQELRLRRELPGNIKVGEMPLQPVNPALFDRNETIDLTLRTLLTAEEPDRREDLQRSIRLRTDASTRAVLERIDKGERIVEDVVFVGGGLLTSVGTTLTTYAGIKSAVISNQELGDPWNDQPIHINSATEATFGGLDLPTLPGSTTPTTPSFQNNAIEAGVLTKVSGEVLTCECNDETVPKRKYVSGTSLGLTTALNIVSATNEVITKQQVDARALRINEDGTKTLTIIDKETGQERTIDAKLVVFLTGPGKERFGIQDASTRELYEDGGRKLRKDIAVAQQAIDILNIQIEGLPDGEERPQRIAERDAIGVELPKILSFTQIKEAYRFWTNNGRRGPSPLVSLSGAGSRTPIRTAIAGGGDTALVEAELILGRGPDSAYPKGFDRTTVDAEVTIYNPPSSIAEDFRVRYQGVVGDPRTVKLPGEKVSGADIDDAGNVLVTTSNGKTDSYDYLLVSTGLEPSPIPREVSDALTAQGYGFSEILDVAGERVALGNADVGVVIAGSATNFTAADFPREVSQLVDTLNIRENTISVWVNSLLLQRCLLSLGIEDKLPVEKQSQIIYAGVPAQPIRPSAQALLMELGGVRLETGPLDAPLLNEKGTFTGAFEQTRPYNAASLRAEGSRIRPSTIGTDPQFVITVLEAVGNQLGNRNIRQLNANTMTFGAERIINGETVEAFERRLTDLYGYSPDRFVDALYGYFGAGLAAGSPGFIVALRRIAEIQKRPPQEVIGEVVPIISAVRTARPDLNEVGGSINGDGRPSRTVDDNMRRSGFFWSPPRQVYEYVKVRSYPGDVEAGNISDPRLSALLEDGRVILESIYVDSVSFSPRNNKEERRVVLPYLQQATQQLIVQAIRNPDLLLDEIVQRRFDQLGFRVNQGATNAANGTQIPQLEQDFRGRFRYTREQFIDVLYGYFGLTLATGSPRAIDAQYPKFSALNRIAELRSEQELRSVTIQEVIDGVLPLINQARTERPDQKLRNLRGTFNYDQTFPFERPLTTYGYLWNGQEYIKKV